MLSSGSYSTSSSATWLNSSPFPAFPASSQSQVTSCGSQDWLVTWGRHCATSGGPEGGWLSRHKPLIMCCSAGPRGFHFCLDSLMLQGSSLTFDPAVKAVMARHRSCWRICGSIRVHFCEAGMLGVVLHSAKPRLCVPWLSRHRPLCFRRLYAASCSGILSSGYTFSRYQRKELQFSFRLKASRSAILYRETEGG